MKTERLWVLGCALAIGACSSGGTQPMETATSESTLSVSTGPESDLRECNETKVRAILIDFAAAYSSPTGDPLKFIAEGNAFQWYSDGLRGGLGYGERGDSRLDPYDRDTLGAYLSWRRTDPADHDDRSCQVQ